MNNLDFKVQTKLSSNNFVFNSLSEVNFEFPEKKKRCSAALKLVTHSVNVYLGMVISLMDGQEKSSQITNWRNQLVHHVILTT